MDDMLFLSEGVRHEPRRRPRELVLVARGSGRSGRRPEEAEEVAAGHIAKLEGVVEV